MKFFVVTFEGSPRWEGDEGLTERLKKHNIEYERVNGQSKFDVTFQDEKLNGINKGKQACFLSHAIALQKGIDSEDDEFGILEDDVLFIDDFHQKFKEQYDNLPDHWKLFLFATYQLNWDGCNYKGKNWELRNILQATDQSFGAYGYIIKRSVAQYMIQFVNKYVKDIYHPTVQEIWDSRHLASEDILAQSEREFSYFSHPFLVIEKSSDSFIQVNSRLQNHVNYFASNKRGNHYS